jgi:hypothetical protein
VRISVGDGVCVSTNNGQLFSIRNGQADLVKLAGIDHPFTAPQPPIRDSSSGLALFADPGNQRIVVADSSNSYRYQYAGAELQGLRAIALDSSSSLLYALSGQRIVSAVLH